MKFQDWIEYEIPHNEVIINASIKNSSDSFLTFPIGVQHDYLKYYYSENNNEFFNHIYKNTELCLSSFAQSTDRYRRKDSKLNRRIINQIISNKPFITKFHADSVSYFKEIGKYKFIICPEGNGIDTHRLWECLYSKGIPIVEYNMQMEEKLSGLPVLYTNDYSELTTEYLNHKYDEYFNSEFDFSKLFLSYYKKDKEIILEYSKHWCIKRDLKTEFLNYYNCKLIL